MKHIFSWTLKAGGIVGLLVFCLLLAWAFESRSMSELRVWHSNVLIGEFTAAQAHSKTTLADYLKHEEDLFLQLQQKVYISSEASQDSIISRYLVNGVQNPETGERNWNRSFELVPEQIKGGILLLHGLTDSPYSLREIGEIFYARGFYVLGMRLPAHGTVPGALTEVSWRDWVAASRIGARHVRERVGATLPFVIAGYSNGGALSVKYSLDALSDSSLPESDLVLLFSPEIGITSISAIANWHKLFSFLPYFAKFKWLSIKPEYDPYKYNSFPKNAAQQAHDLSIEVQNQIKQAREQGKITDFPPVLTFISRKDSTVKVSATVSRLHEQLENEKSELVVFDINHLEQISALIPAHYDAPLKRIAERSTLPYRLTIISNTAIDSGEVIEIDKAPRSSEFVSTPLGLAWPPGVFSLSHVGIPFSTENPVYGSIEQPNSKYRGLPLGRLSPRGETGLLRASMAQLMRLRHNPFFSYIEERIQNKMDQLDKK